MVWNIANQPYQRIATDMAFVLETFRNHNRMKVKNMLEEVDHITQQIKDMKAKSDRVKINMQKDLPKWL